MERDGDLHQELLVAKAQMGDAAALEQLIRAHQAKLIYYIKKMLLRKDLAEDIAQEVWLAVWRQLRRLRAAEAFNVWLYRIAHTETVRLIRQESRYVELSKSYDAPTGPDQDAENDFSEEEIQLLNLALERLHHPLREALTLRFIEGMQYEEIAQVTGVPVGTVRSRLHYARQALRREMESMKHGAES